MSEKSKKPEVQQSIFRNIISSIQLNFAKKPEEKKDEKLAPNLYDNPALSVMKLSMKDELINESVFTKNSKLSSHTVDAEIRRKNMSKFKKFVNEKGKSFSKCNFRL